LRRSSASCKPPGRARVLSKVSTLHISLVPSLGQRRESRRASSEVLKMRCGNPTTNITWPNHPPAVPISINRPCPLTQSTSPGTTMDSSRPPPSCGAEVNTVAALGGGDGGGAEEAAPVPSLGSVWACGRKGGDIRCGSRAPRPMAPALSKRCCAVGDFWGEADSKTACGGAQDFWALTAQCCGAPPAIGEGSREEKRDPEQVLAVPEGA